MGNVHLKWAFSEAAVTFLRWRGSRRNVTGDAAFDTIAFYDAAGARAWSFHPPRRRRYLDAGRG